MAMHFEEAERGIVITSPSITNEQLTNTKVNISLISGGEGKLTYLVFDGKVIMESEKLISTDLNIDSDNENFISLNIDAYEGSGVISFIDNDFLKNVNVMTYLEGLSELMKNYPEEVKKPDIRQDINSFLKRGKKW